MLARLRLAFVHQSQRQRQRQREPGREPTAGRQAGRQHESKLPSSSLGSGDQP